jgi:glutathione synthase/RimK-type ligase-like ATP-grasp enzyme
LRIALLTARTMPEPDPDLEPLVRAVEALGARAHIVAWDDPTVELGAFDAAVLRSTWNYVPVRDAFCDWVARAARTTRFFNPPDVVRWNTDKIYLRDLDARGIPIVPTRFPTDANLGDLEWDDIVIKPRISAGSVATRRFVLSNERGEAETFLGAQLRERSMMVQPYMTNVAGDGERAIVQIDGKLTHAIRKHPRFSDGEERVSAALPIAEDERAIALRALEPYEGRLLYARVDLVRGSDGAPRVMELELAEPSLFLVQHPPALDRFARAIAARARS